MCKRCPETVDARKLSVDEAKAVLSRARDQFTKTGRCSVSSGTIQALIRRIGMR